MSRARLKNKIQNEAYQILRAQLLGVLITSLLVLVFANKTQAFSVATGGLAYCVPNFLFAWKVFSYVGAAQVEKFIMAFFVGEACKIIICAILVLLIVKYLPVSLLSVLLGLIVAIVSFWAATIWYYGLKNSKKIA